MYEIFIYLYYLILKYICIYYTLLKKELFDINLKVKKK